MNLAGILGIILILAGGLTVLFIRRIIKGQIKNIDTDYDQRLLVILTMTANTLIITGIALAVAGTITFLVN